MSTSSRVSRCGRRLLRRPILTLAVRPSTLLAKTQRRPTLIRPLCAFVFAYVLIYDHANQTCVVGFILRYEQVFTANTG